MRIAKKLAAAFLVVCLMISCVVSVSAAENDYPDDMKNGMTSGLKNGTVNGLKNGELKNAE